LISVLAAASLLEAPISLNLAAEQLKSHSLEGSQQPLSIATVQQVVSEHFSLTVPELIARKRTRQLVFPRQIAMYLCREMLNSSFPSIARAFGGKDHSTVIHSCGKVREQMKDTAVEALVNELAARLRTGA
jgi:chromosomal replication initiator protein